MFSMPINTIDGKQEIGSEQENDRAKLLIQWIQIGLNWMLFFPVLLFERFVKRKIPHLYAFPLLALAAFLGLYDFLYGSLGYPVYDLTIEFSNQSLISSMAALTIVKGAEIFGTFVPGFQAVGEILQHIGDYLANGVLALAIQSVFLVLVKEGLILRYLLGFGFLLLAIPALSRLGQRLVFGGLLLFIIMPPVVYLESFVYERLKSPIQEQLETNYDQLKAGISFGGWDLVERGATAVIEGVTEGATAVTEGVTGGATAVTEGVASLASRFGDLISADSSSDPLLALESPPDALVPEIISDTSAAEIEDAEEGTNEIGLLDTIRNLGQAIINSLILLFTITIMTCLVAPIVAYFLIFKLLREVLTHDYFEIITPK
jgi:hypothetical protein